MKTLSTQGSLDARLEGTPHPTFGEAFRFWLKLGFISFGGPTGQIAIMHAELVDLTLNSCAETKGLLPRCPLSLRQLSALY
jgi:hypothetical protein